MLIAEQCVDRRSRTYLFRGRQIESVTGRVLLHAIDGAGRPLCGCGREHLTPTGQPWQASYLPHLPRCRGCALLADAAVPGQPARTATCPLPPRRPAKWISAQPTGPQPRTRAALREVLAGHDLRCWMFTDLVTIDETIRGGFSHPLTLSPALLVRRPALALTSFLHEQLHWMEGPGTEAAAAEAGRRWPDPPPPPAGAADPRSTWIHLSVCALEYLSLAGILGPAAAAASSGSMRATPGSTARSSPAPAGFPASFAALASRCPDSLRFFVATSANGAGKAPERWPEPHHGQNPDDVTPLSGSEHRVIQGGGFWYFNRRPTPFQ